MPKYSARNLNYVPWFIFSIDTGDLIISKTIPDSVSDVKPITRPGTQIPGGDSEVSKFGSIGSRRISFSIRFAKFNSGLGVAPTVKALENLRNPTPPLLGFGTPDPFTSNPEVIYWHGTGSLPLQYFVNRCDFTHSYPNRLGNPQVTDASIELILNEGGDLVFAEELYRQVTAKLSYAQSLRSGFGNVHPYHSGARFL